MAGPTTQGFRDILNDPAERGQYWGAPGTKPPGRAPVAHPRGSFELSHVTIRLRVSALLRISAWFRVRSAFQLPS